MCGIVHAQKSGASTMINYAEDTRSGLLRRLWLCLYHYWND